jgi:Protein kinase domain
MMHVRAEERAHRVTNLENAFQVLVREKSNKGPTTYAAFYDNIPSRHVISMEPRGIDWPLSDIPLDPPQGTKESTSSTGVQAIVSGVLTKLNALAESKKWNSYPDPEAYKKVSFSNRKPDVVAYKAGLTGCLAITFFGDLKGRDSGDFTSEQKGHVLDMARKFMEFVSPSRPFLVVFLSDGHRWQFFRVLREDNELVYMEEPVIDDSMAGWKRLVSLLKADMIQLGYDLPIIDEVELITPLGRGASACAYEARHKGDAVLVKIFFADHEDSFHAESDALAILKGLSGVPQILVQPQVKNNLKTFYKSAIVVTPIGKTFKEMPISGYHLGQLVKIVKLAHDKKLIHRDIKPNNVYCHEDCMLLSDWGSAIGAQSEITKWQGTYGYSVSPLDPLYNAGPQVRDLVSVVRTAYSLLFGIKTQASEQEIIEYWNKILRANTVWEEAMGYAKSLNYEKLAELLSKLK